MFSFLNRSDSSFIKKEDIDKIVEKEEKIPEEKIPEEKWIWVDGIKGMTLDMKGKNNFQFEIGKKYVHEGEVSLCESGFHFSKSVEDASNYYNLLFSRFFKVKGLVREKDLERYRSKSEYMYFYTLDTTPRDKLVAREIEIVSELTEEEYLKILKPNSKFIQSIEDIERIRELKNFTLFKKEKSRKILEKCGFVETFIEILLDEANDSGKVEKISFLAEALIEENVSKDMTIFLLMKELKKEN